MMDLSTQDQLIAIFALFLTLDTIAVGLRLLVRLRLQRSAFGWDDVFLTLTYMGLVLQIGLALQAMHYGAISPQAEAWHDGTRAHLYTAILCIVCYIIAGTVKISVALVIYRLLDYRPVMKAIVIADIVMCCLWTVLYTLVLGIGCAGDHISPYHINRTVCGNFNYSQGASYLVFSAIQVAIPVALFWNTQIRKRHKWAVICLFSLGFLSGIAVCFKIGVLFEYYHANASTDFRDLWVRGVMWAVIEHGVGLFAGSMLAVGPLCGPVVQGWTTISGSISRCQLFRRRSSPPCLPCRRNNTSCHHDWGCAGSHRDSARGLVSHRAMPTTPDDDLTSDWAAAYLRMSGLDPPEKPRPVSWDHRCPVPEFCAKRPPYERSVSFGDSASFVDTTPPSRAESFRKGHKKSSQSF